MSPPNERITDLFIPVHRPRSSTSTVRTGTSLNTITASATIKSDSTSPTTVSSKKSTRDGTSRSMGTGSPASIRYTITAPAPDTHRKSISRTSSSVSQHKRPNTVHLRRHSRNSSSAIPIQELTMRLTQATGDAMPGDTSTSTSRSNERGPRVTDSLLNEESLLNVTAPTPFTSPELSPVTTKTATHLNARTGPSLTDPTEMQRGKSVKQLENFLSNLSSLVRPSHSRSSSQSDRSFPPTSFPTDFQDEGGLSKSSRKSVSRSSSSKQALLTSQARSTSPLKFQVTPDGGSSGSPASKLSRSNTARATSNRPADYTARPKLSRPVSLASSRSSSFHAIVHHYTTCPHTSPPASRPLDIQPTLNEACYPPRSMIAGSCFECDTLDRREEEASILLSYNPRITAHMTDLELIVTSLEKLSPVSPMSPTAAAAQFENLSIEETLAGTSQLSFPEALERDDTSLRRTSGSSLVSEDADSESTVYRIQALEDRIAELVHCRDRDVKEVWKGYPQRWGPGVLGVARTLEGDRAASSRAASSLGGRASMDGEGSERSSIHGASEGRMRVDWIRDEIE